MRIPPLAGLAEVAQILGVRKTTAARYTYREDFPQPVARLAMGPVWAVEDVEEWAKQYGPIRRGRPHKRATGE